MNDLLPQTATEKIIESYADEIAKKNREIELLNDKLATISTVSYSAGIPQVKYNRGDESNDFSFPVRWAQTCKKMENSIYLEPILQFYKNTFNTFNYEIKKPDEYEQSEKVRNAYDFMTKQFERAGGLKNLIVNIAYNTLVFGFAFFTPKLEVIDGKKWGVKGKIDGLKGFKYYDPTQIYNFVFKENDADELQAITLLTSPKLLGGSDRNKGYMLEDYYNEWAEGNFENAKLIKIDFDLMLGGYATYGNLTGDVIGKPFLYSAYSMWQVLESMDNSFNRNLNNIGEHSFNFVAYNSTEGLNEATRKETEIELQKFIKNKGGIYIGSHGKLEKIECIDANEWWQFRDSMLSSLFKNKGLDIKALGLNRGATKDLAAFSQTDTVLMANDIMENILLNINNTFMKRYFDLNFKTLRTLGECDYFQIKHEVPEIKNNQGESFIAMSGIKGDDGVKKEFIELKDKDGNISTQKTTFDKNNNPTSQESRIHLGKFIKRKPNGLESYIIKDTSLLNQNLIVLSEELNDYILEFMKEAMRDPKIIELALKKPDEFIKTSLLTPAKRKQLLEELQGILERNVGNLFDIKATEIMHGTANKDFQAIFGIAKNEWINKMTQEYIRKNAINVGRTLIARTELKATEALRNFTAGYTKDTDLSEAVNNVFERVFQFKGKEIDTATQNEAVSVFQEVSNQANENASKKIKDLAFIRCGYLENMCKECQKYYNVLYVSNGVGGYYNSEGIEYKTLPDADCLGGKENCKCYYAPIDTKVLDIINNMLEN